MKTSYYFDAQNYRKQLNMKNTPKQFGEWLRTRLPFLFLMIGLLYGAMLLQENALLLEQFSLLQAETLTKRLEAHFFAILGSALFSNFLYLLLIALFGFWAFGSVFCILLLFFKGMSLGALIGSMFLTYGMTGIGYATLLILPGAVLSLSALLFATKESFRLSGMFFSAIVKGDFAANVAVVKLYGLKQLVLLLFMTVAAVVDGITAMIGAQLFSL